MLPTCSFQNDTFIRCIFCLFCSYENSEIALNCGVMLRESLRYEPIASLILMANPDLFKNFFKYVELSTFDIASDAFATFKVIPLYYAESLTNAYCN